MDEDVSEKLRKRGAEGGGKSGDASLVCPAAAKKMTYCKILKSSHKS